MNYQPLLPYLTSIQLEDNLKQLQAFVEQQRPSEELDFIKISLFFDDYQVMRQKLVQQLKSLQKQSSFNNDHLDALQKHKQNISRIRNSVEFVELLKTKNETATNELIQSRAKQIQLLQLLDFERFTNDEQLIDVLNNNIFVAISASNLDDFPELTASHQFGNFFISHQEQISTPLQFQKLCENLENKRLLLRNDHPGVLDAELSSADRELLVVQAANSQNHQPAFGFEPENLPGRTQLPAELPLFRAGPQAVRLQRLCLAADENSAGVPWLGRRAAEGALRVRDAAVPAGAGFLAGAVSDHQQANFGNLSVRRFPQERLGGREAAEAHLQNRRSSGGPRPDWPGALSERPRVAEDQLRREHCGGADRRACPAAGQGGGRGPAPRAAAERQGCLSAGVGSAGRAENR